VGVATIRRAEVVDEEIAVTRANEAAIRALEAAGVEFIDDNSGGEGVLFQKAQIQRKRT
jgi:hypothetical protein